MSSIRADRMQIRLLVRDVQHRSSGRNASGLDGRCLGFSGCSGLHGRGNRGGRTRCVSGASNPLAYLMPTTSMRTRWCPTPQQPGVGCCGVPTARGRVEAEPRLRPQRTALSMRGFAGRARWGRCCTHPKHHRVIAPRNINMAAHGSARGRAHSRSRGVGGVFESLGSDWDMPGSPSCLVRWSDR